MLLIIWLGLIVFGYRILLNYEFRTNPTDNESIKKFPKASKLKLDPHQETLLMFAHPHCPCSKASLEELNKLLAGSPHNKLKVIIVFVKPKKFDETWVKADLWQRAITMPNVSTYIDEENHEAKLFKANTSGEIFLFRPNGGLVFHGGITASRGHEGDSKGRSSITKYLKTKKISVKESPAFGCVL